MLGAYYGLGFRAKITLPLALVTLILILSAFLSIDTSKNIASDADTIGNVVLKQIDYLLQADRDLYQSQLAELSLLYVDPGKKEWIDDHNSNANQVIERSMKALDLGRIPNLEARRNQLQQLYDDWRAASDEVIKLAVKRRTLEAVQISRGRCLKAFGELRHFIDVVQEEQIVTGDAFTKRAIASAKKQEKQLLWATLIGVILALIGVIFVPPLVINPLNRVTTRIHEISLGGGDLTARLNVQGDDELSQLSSGFNTFVASLHSLISNMKACALQVQNSSGQLLTIAETNYEAIGSQTDAISTVAESSVELSAAVQAIARSAEVAASQSHSARDRCENGTTTVESTVRSIQSIAGQLTNSTELMDQVEDQLTKVSRLLQIIRSVTKQTNLLALNASIEAQRAGSESSGFAIIAEEVRLLSNQTRESAGEIETLLGSLSQGIAQAATTVRECESAVQSTVSKATQTGIIFSDVNRSINHIADMASEIAGAVSQQSQVMDHIRLNLNSMSEQAITTARSTEQTKAAGNKLKKASHQLATNVGSFKV